MTKELQMFKTNSPEKARIDEQMNIAEILIKRTWTIINRCRRLMNMDMENLKRIKAIIHQSELFTSNVPIKKQRSIKIIMDKCLKSLVETL